MVKIINNYLSKKFKVISFIAIIMVVYIHAYNLTDRFLQPFTTISNQMNFSSFFQYFISNGLTRIAVPLFFAISGYLFYHNLSANKNSFLAKYKSRAKTLLLPYLLCSVVSLLFLYLGQEFVALMGIEDFFIEATFVENLVRNFAVQDYIAKIFFSSAAYQLWFIWDLMIYVILSPLIYYYLKRNSYLALIPFAIFWLFDLHLFINSEGILFFMLGAFLAIKEINFQREFSKRKINIILILWLLVLVLKTFLAYYDLHFVLLALHKIAIILGFIGLWYGYDIYIGELRDNHRIFYLTSFTFFIFLFHVPLLDFLTDICLGLFGSSQFLSLAVYLLNPIFVMGLLIVVAELLRRYLTSVYSIVTGGRGVKKH